MNSRSPSGRNLEDSALPSDEELLRRYSQAGEAEAFEQLIRRYETELYRYLHRLLGDPTAAEDVFQSTFLQLHAKCHQYDPGRRVRPWLYRIATNQAIDYQRRHRRHRTVSLEGGATDGQAQTLEMLPAPGQLSPDKAAALQEQREAVLRALEELPPSLRQLVELIYFQGLKYREAAQVLDLPLGTVKSRLHAAMKRLDQALRPPASSPNPKVSKQTPNP